MKLYDESKIDSRQGKQLRFEIFNLNSSANTQIIELNCSDNDLSSLNINTGNNLLVTFNCTINEDLLCIDVNDLSYANSQTTSGNWEKDNTSDYSIDCTQHVYIPDPNFKLSLLNDAIADFDDDGIYDGDVDTNNDGEITIS